MTSFLDNLVARRKALGLTVEDVAAALNRRGMDVASSTVASWFNGNRGTRWKVDELRALLDVLQTDLQAMAGEGAELVEAAVPAATAREMRDLSVEQQQAILTMVRSMRSK